MHPCIHASMHPCIHASRRPCVHASMHPSMHPSIHISISLYVHPSICPSVRPSVRPSCRPHRGLHARGPSRRPRALGLAYARAYRSGRLLDDFGVLSLALRACTQEGHGEPEQNFKRTRHGRRFTTAAFHTRIQGWGYQTRGQIVFMRGKKTNIKGIPRSAWLKQN